MDIKKINYALECFRTLFEKLKKGGNCCSWMCFGACLFPFPGSLVFLDCFSRKPTTPSSFGFVATSQSAFSIRHLLWRWTPGAWPLRTVELPKLRRAAGPPKGVTWLSGHGNRDGRHGRVVVGIFSAYFAPENEIHDLKKQCASLCYTGKELFEVLQWCFFGGNAKFAHEIIISLGKDPTCVWKGTSSKFFESIKQKNLLKLPNEARLWELWITFVGGTMKHQITQLYSPEN